MSISHTLTYMSQAHLHKHQLKRYLQDILPLYPDGISEYDLLQRLKKPPYAFYNDNLLADPLMMFQTHFLLFNVLYQLRDEWIEAQHAELDIHCSAIKMRPWQQGSYGLQQQDKLREYYLNWDNFTDTDQQEVETLLDTFWAKLGKIPANDLVAHISVEDAMQILELAELTSPSALKQQYRRLLHQHHPDKGGETGYTQKLQQAYQCLKYQF
ncbi:DNA-J related domain-containing protein [Neptunicella sp.]|uniref:DNA-J related domain-containing protein n=1 Tax=Neptunicella sp. TaxID=2125986 RepID=UPI003F691A98